MDRWIDMPMCIHIIWDMAVSTYSGVLFMGVLMRKALLFEVQIFATYVEGTQF